MHKELNKLWGRGKMSGTPSAFNTWRKIVETFRNRAQMNGSIKEVRASSATPGPWHPYNPGTQVVQQPTRHSPLGSQRPLGRGSGGCQGPGVAKRREKEAFLGLWG